MEVCYCVVKKMELSSEYFGRYCQKLLNQFLFYIFQDIQLVFEFLYNMVEDTASIIVVLFGS